MLRSSQNGSCNSRKETNVEAALIKVVAPTTLCEGYTFSVQFGDASFPVSVPSGGIRAGETFLAPLPTDMTVGACCTRTTNSSRHAEKGRGQWKDGLFACFRHGICHPHLWNAWLCPQVLMAQILARMKLKSWPFVPPESSSNNRKQSNQTMRTIVFFLVSMTLYDAWMAPPLIEFTTDENGNIIVEQPKESDGPNGILWHQLFYLLLTFPMTVYGLFVMVKLRAAVRAKYGIPTGRLGRLEDFAYAFCCNCCILSQMARQTADYDDEPAACCSPNGMKRRHPSSTNTNATCDGAAESVVASLNTGSV